jgi:hypothetical protein
MAKDFKQRFFNTVQNGLNTVSTAMLQQQHFGPTAFYPSTLDQMVMNWVHLPISQLDFLCVTVPRDVLKFALTFDVTL